MALKMRDWLSMRNAPFLFSGLDELVDFSQTPIQCHRCGGEHRDSNFRPPEPVANDPCKVFIALQYWIAPNSRLAR